MKLTPHSLRSPAKQFNDKVFVDNAKWLAFAQNSLTWPNHWRAVIFRIDKKVDITKFNDTYVVWPRNPEYDAYMDKQEELLWEYATPGGKPTETLLDPLKPVPPMHLGPIEFESMDDIEAWAKTVARMK